MTKKEFDALVFIGRFQPFHKGHESVVRKAIELSKQIIVVVGSSFEARSIRNPFTFEERKQMIKSVFPQDSVVVVPVSDYPYDDRKWVSAVQNVVHGAIKWSADPLRIGLIGHEKDGTSYYLKIFPTWGSVSVANSDGINATEIRMALLGDNEEKYDITSVTPTEVVRVMSKIISDGPDGYSDSWMTLRAEYRMVKKYKEAWKSAPFPPTFMTVDAVVVKSGHVLVVKRGASPGKGLWALPGGFLNQNETMLDGAVRELREETRLKVPQAVLKGSVVSSKTFDAPNRSARGRTITQAFFIDLGVGQLDRVKGSDDAAHAMWMPMYQVVAERDRFFEDHVHIIDYFVPIL